MYKRQVLVCNDNVFKGSKNFCNELVKSFPSIKTVVLNVNKRKTSIVLGNEEKVLYGKGFIAVSYTHLDVYKRQVVVLGIDNLST